MSSRRWIAWAPVVFFVFYRILFRFGISFCFGRFVSFRFISFRWFRIASVVSLRFAVSDFSSCLQKQGKTVKKLSCKELFLSSNYHGRNETKMLFCIMQISPKQFAKFNPFLLGRFSNIVLSFCVYLFLNIVQKDVKSNQTVVNSLSVAICYCSENLCKPHCAFVLS